ncbi:MAG: T9SS type A sorting domain-containing protein [Ignavibacteriaceae bacterium]|nr:T9SS type A sorting domain-containing protein [Ignavibacteriaceae bacterium]
MKKIINKLSILLLPAVVVLFLSVNLRAQVLEWAKQTEGEISQYAGNMHLDIDADENFYLSGKFDGTLELDLTGNGSLTVQDLHPPDVGAPNFIAKYDSNGSILWAFAIGAIASDGYDFLDINDLHVDYAGNIIIVGAFECYPDKGIDFDPGSGTTLLTGPQSTAFAAKYDTNGNLLWAFSFYTINNINFGINGAFQELSGVTTDANGNIFLTGRITAQVLGGGIELILDLNPLGTTNYVNVAGAIVAKYSPDGILQWHKIYTRTDGYAVQGSIGEKIALDASGNIFTTGEFSRIIDFGNGFTNPTDQSTMGTYLLKLDATGNTTWMILLDNDIPDLGAMEPFSILTTSSNNVVIAGLFDNTVDFDPGAGVASLTSFLLPGGVYDDDGFIVSYDADGNFRWVDHVGGGTSEERIFSIAENSAGDVFSTGDGNTGFFLKKLDGQTGATLALYEKQYAPGYEIELGVGYGAVISPNDNMYLTGKVFQDSIDVDFSGNEFFIVDPPGTTDEALFVARYNSLQTPTGISPGTDETILNASSLEQNYPNPFNPSTQIKFAISKTSNVKLEIYNLLGQKVATLVNENLTSGNYSADWNAANFSSGTYIYRLTTDTKVKSKKMMLIK